MSHQDHSVSPPPGLANPTNTAAGVRRHHTITAGSRTTRPTSKIQAQEVEDDEQEQGWNQDEVVDQDWRGGIGAVGEKASLHRQASLPTRYHRGTRRVYPWTVYMLMIYPSFRWHWTKAAWQSYS